MNNHLNIINNSPVFYTGWKPFLLALKSASKHYALNKNGGFFRLLPSIKNIFVSLQLRKKLYLTKLIKFNGKYYSTPTIPSFPSRAFDSMVSKGGLNFLSAGTPTKTQIDSAFIAISNKCELKCEHCYESHNLRSELELPNEKLIEIVNILQKKGVSIIILTGGEPLLEFDKIKLILKEADLNLSEFHLHTSGTGITESKVNELKNLGLTAAAVGLDDVNMVRHDSIRGKGSFSKAVEALRLFNNAGIFTYVNLCATAPLIRSGGLWKYFDFVKKLNVSIIQLLEPRPWGAYQNKNIQEIFSETDRQILTDFMRKGNTNKKYKNHPLIYYVSHIEGKDQMGCMMGGLSHFHIDSAGNVNPCVFLPVSFGNIMENEFNEIYSKMRSIIPKPAHTECPSLLLNKKLKEANIILFNVPIPYDDIKHEWNSIIPKE